MRPGYTAGEVPAWDSNRVIPEPGCFTDVLSCLAETLPLLIFAVPHGPSPPPPALTYRIPLQRPSRTSWATGDIWAAVMFGWVQEDIAGVEKVSPNLQGKVLCGGCP